MRVKEPAARGVIVLSGDLWSSGVPLYEYMCAHVGVGVHQYDLAGAQRHGYIIAHTCTHARTYTYTHCACMHAQ